MSAAAESRVIELTSTEQFIDLSETHKANGIALLFWADFDHTSKPGGPFATVFSRLSSMYAQPMFVRVEAEHFPTISERYAVEAVPTVITLRNGEVQSKVEGADPAALAKAAQKDLATPTATAAAQSAPSAEAMDARLHRLINAAPVMLFMKGSPRAPRCKFSRAMVELLDAAGAQYGSFDILSDMGVRQELKRYSNWPTYPQLYAKGKLVGGLDVVKELKEDGELADLLAAPAPAAAASAAASVPAPAATTPLRERLHALTHQAPVMLFMKGSPEAPRCGFSARMVEMLQGEGLAFSSFDILSDDAVRQGLKEFSNWPTYPQLYHNGKLVGGLDVVKEMIEEEGSLKSALGV